MARCDVKSDEELNENYVISLVEEFLEKVTYAVYKTRTRIDLTITYNRNSLTSDFIRPRKRLFKIHISETGDFQIPSKLISAYTEITNIELSMYI